MLYFFLLKNVVYILFSIILFNIDGKFGEGPIYTENIYNLLMIKRVN